MIYLNLLQSNFPNTTETFQVKIDFTKKKLRLKKIASLHDITDVFFSATLDNIVKSNTDMLKAVNKSLEDLESQVIYSDFENFCNNYN